MDERELRLLARFMWILFLGAVIGYFIGYANGKDDGIRYAGTIYECGNDANCITQAGGNAEIILGGSR